MHPTGASQLKVNVATSQHESVDVQKRIFRNGELSRLSKLR